jgi:hypothetical protein
MENEMQVIYENDEWKLNYILEEELQLLKTLNLDRYKYIKEN